MLSVLNTSTQFGGIVGKRKDFLLTLRGSLSGINFRLKGHTLKHDRAVPEFLDQCFLALNGSIRYVRNLFTFIIVPTEATMTIDELNDIEWIVEVYEGITHVAIVGKVDSEVYEIICSMAVYIN